jgi:hypothetical protein
LGQTAREEQQDRRLTIIVVLRVHIVHVEDVVAFIVGEFVVGRHGLRSEYKDGVPDDLSNCQRQVIWEETYSYRYGLDASWIVPALKYKDSVSTTACHSK